MAAFIDLPLELIPFIVQNLPRPYHLSQVALINKNFYTYTIPRLYERTSIFAWHKEGKKKATLLFWTLANCPHLARYVKKLELRDFPKAISRESSSKLTQLCVEGIQNCISLEECTWTRDGSLKDDILEALSRCPRLEVLEINGRHNRNYEPALLTSFSGLRKITIIMPTSEVIQTFPDFFEKNRESLQDLRVVCKVQDVLTDHTLLTHSSVITLQSSPLVTDDLLRRLAHSLSCLRHLHLAGCTKITHEGIAAVLSANGSGIADLALEGVSTSFDMQEFGNYSDRTRALKKLQSVTFTFPLAGMTREWLMQVAALLSNSPLAKFSLYVSGATPRALLPLDINFIQEFINRHASHLKTFAVLRIPISLNSLDYIVRHSQLEKLFVSLRRNDLGMLGPIVARSTTIRSLHVTYALGSGLRDRNGDEDEDEDTELALTESDQIDVNRPLPSMEELQKIASHFGPSITQFGVQTRVWQVERVATRESDGTLATGIRLGPYESPDVPDVFTVLRT